MALPPMRHDGGRELRSARSAAWQLYISVGIFSFAVNLLMLTGPLFIPTLLGNASANLVRNLWTFSIIFCGHFTEQAEVFPASVLEGESRGHWYLRQLRGSLRWVKIGLQMFTAYGPDYVKAIADDGFKVFLDLKLHDIPNTVRRAMRKLACHPYMEPD